MKYWIIFKNSLQATFAYRVNFYSGIMHHGLSLVIFAYIWLSIYRQGGLIGTYSLGGLIFYYFVTVFINLFNTGSSVAWPVGDEIREGRISIYLVAPIDYFRMHLAKSFGESFAGLIVFLPTFFIALFFFQDGIVHWRAVPIFLLSLFFSFMLDFVISYTIGISTFCFGLVQGLNFTLSNIIRFFSGMVIPLSILPTFWRNMADWLPFKYIIYVPNQIISGRLDFMQASRELVVAAVWIVILLMISRIIYTRGLRRFDGEGL